VRLALEASRRWEPGTYSLRPGRPCALPTQAVKPPWATLPGQAAPPAARHDQLVRWEAAAARSISKSESSGRWPCSPRAASLIVPEQEGLALRPLPPRPIQRQCCLAAAMLSSFVRWPAAPYLFRHGRFRRSSVKLVGTRQRAPPLWLGQRGLVASACLLPVASGSGAVD